MKGQKTLGAFSMLGTFGLLTLIVWKSGVFGMVFHELVIFISGGFREIAINHPTFPTMFMVLLAVVVLTLPCSFCAAILQEKILGKSSENVLRDFFKEMKEGNHFFYLFVIIFLEELFARWFLLGLLTKIPFLSGTIAFYALFLIGNFIWALIHLKSYEEEKDRKILRVLPQFVGGIFFTYVFVKYGFLAVVLVHFASNAVLFSIHKTQHVNVIDGLMTSYSALCAIISYVLIEKPITDILPWFANNPVFRLQGWEFWDYVKVSVFLFSCLVIIFDLLLYDRGERKKEKLHEDLGVVGFALGVLIIIGLLYSIYFLSGLFIANTPYQLLVPAILFTFLQKGSSGSAVARTFWSSLPEIYIALCVLQALGVWLGIVWLVLMIIIDAPRIILNEFDENSNYSLSHYSSLQHNK